jgi:hypothetical protein
MSSGLKLRLLIPVTGPISGEAVLDKKQGHENRKSGLERLSPMRIHKPAHASL